MKRVSVLLLVSIIVGMLVVVAPVSAATLHGQWTGGEANGTGGIWPDWGLQADPTEILGASGLANITTYPTYTDVASLMIITADPGVPPFPVRMNAQAVFRWGPATLNGDTWTVNGQLRLPSLLRAGLTWEATLEADTGSHELTMVIVTTGSNWGWATWVLNGELF